MLLAVGICLLFPACDDPKKPETWIKKLRDPEHANKAVKQLRKLGDPKAVMPLCDLFKDFPSPNILSAIISFKDRRSIPTLISALDFTEDQYHNATKAAAALADFKAEEAVPEMCKVLERPMAIKSRANLAKLAVIKALGRIGSKKAVPCLIKTLEKRPEEQDFLLNKTAAVALGNLKDPRSISVLIRGLFMASTIQGTSYPQARVALVKMGKPAVQPLIAALEGKDEKLNKMAKDLDFKPGVVLGKTARVLGDMMATEAVPALLEILKNASVKPGDYTKGIDGVIEALGKSFDERAVDPLLELLQNKNADYKVRMQVCNALTVMGSKKSLPILLEGAQKWFIQGGFTNLKDAAAMAYSRVAGAETKEGMPIFQKLHDEEKNLGNKALFKEVLDRLKVSNECGDDATCYGKKVANDKLTLAQREKAGLMIGILPDGRKALPALVKALPVREPVLRLYYLQAAKRIGKASDKDLVDTLTRLAEKDSKRKVKYLGADLASEDKVALAVVTAKK
jgi:HEAT repeat protein